MVCQTYGRNIQPNNYLIGYMLKASGSLDLDVTLGANSCVTFKFQLDRVNGIKQYTIDTSRCSAPDIELWSLVIGNEISYNNVTGKNVWPVYFSLKSTTNVTLGVTAKSYAEAAFFMPLVTSWDDMIVDNDDVMEEIEIIGEYNETYYASNTYTTAYYNHFVKYKEMVTGTLVLQTPTNNVANGTVIFKIPEEIAPKRSIVIDSISANESLGQAYNGHYISIGTDGTAKNIGEWQTGQMPGEIYINLGYSIV